MSIHDVSLSLHRIAVAIVDLALVYADWSKEKNVPLDQSETLLEATRQAGFEVATVIYERLRGDYLEQDGSRTGSTYLINPFSPFAFKDSSGRFDYAATQWMDALLARVVSSKTRARSERIDMVEQLLVESMPLEPIQLTLDGDFLRETPPTRGYTHTRDQNKMSLCIGLHKYCDGWIDRRQTTALNDALVCRQCGLRLVIPHSLQTYGELRKFLAAKLNTKSSE